MQPLGCSRPRDILVVSSALARKDYLLLPLLIFGEIQEFGPCTRQSGSQVKTSNLSKFTSRNSTQKWGQKTHILLQGHVADMYTLPPTKVGFFSFSFFVLSLSLSFSIDGRVFYRAGAETLTLSETGFCTPWQFKYLMYPGNLIFVPVPVGGHFCKIVRPSWST